MVEDVLRQFYEVFLKYANDAKKIGIVLTPRHITEFAVNCSHIDYNDYVFDPHLWHWWVSSFCF